MLILITVLIYILIGIYFALVCMASMLVMNYSTAKEYRPDHDISDRIIIGILMFCVIPIWPGFVAIYHFIKIFDKSIKDDFTGNFDFVMDNWFGSLHDVLEPPTRGKSL